MADVLLFHHAQGLTAGVLAFADELRAPGTPCTRRTSMTATPSRPSTRAWPTPVRSASASCSSSGVRAADDLPAELVYAGFSLGVMPAQQLAQTRAGAKGALFFDACLPPSEFGSWPEELPVQIHGMDADPFFAGEGTSRPLANWSARPSTPNCSSTRATSTCSPTAACAGTTRRRPLCSPGGCSTSWPTADPPMDLEFSGEIWYWRGPAPITSSPCRTRSAVPSKRSRDR